MRHNKAREMPFPLYMGLELHTNAKLKQMIPTFEKLGLCVSYQREREVNKAFPMGVSEWIKKEGLVVPMNMIKNVFTTTDLDNINQHKRSNLSKDEFHGALITVTNHLSRENLGEPKENINFTDLNIVSKPDLPASYSVVPLAELKRTDDPVRPRHDRISGALVKDCAWILKAPLCKAWISQYMP